MLRRALVLGLCLVVLTLPDGPLIASARLATPGPVWGEHTAIPGSAKTSSGAASASVQDADPTPSRLLIGRISVDAKVEALGLDRNRNIASPNNYYDVAWYNLGPAPGEPGNALINGHVSWWTGTAVFAHLSELRPGDEVVIERANGAHLTFKVTGTTIVAAGARIASLFAPSSVATLTLITCTGEWDPRKQSDTRRLLVTAVLE
jgi:LPXTG-site transpeptidase (sortase) family protein